jgi:hypothetical protein
MENLYLHKFLNYFEDFITHYKKNIVFNVEKLNFQSENNLLNADNYLDISIVNDIKKMKVGERRISKLIFENISIDLTWEFWDHKINNCKLINFLFDYTCFLIFYFNKIKPEDRILKIYLYNFQGNKVIPNNNILKGINVNSGVTYFSPPLSSVLVYRKEEMIKVLTHELIHACGIDDKMVASYKIDKLNELFCVERDINVNETFTDAFACLINLTMFTILKNCKGLKLLSRFKSNFNNELSFIKGQAYKVLLLNKYALSKDKIICTIKNEEKTNGIAYYVLKAVIFNNFINYILKHNFILKDVDDFLKYIYIGINKINWDTFGKNEYDKMDDKHNLRMSNINILELININKTI